MEYDNDLEIDNEEVNFDFDMFIENDIYSALINLPYYYSKKSL